jgi:biotin-dependent carboxylase-like uncharacterized protein
MAEKQVGFVIENAGFLSLLQDGGRTGVMHMGLASGGVMDRHAWAWGNYLLGNAYGTAALEITFGKIEFVSQLDTKIAITGARVDCTVNRKAQPLWETVAIQAGDRVVLSTPKAGLRSYLTVAGGFAVPPALGQSCSTLHREKTGGLHNNGEPLKAGDLLPCTPGMAFGPKRKVPAGWIPDYTRKLILDVVSGVQADRFPAASLERFFSEQYTMSAQTDRMGTRLEGPALEVLGERLISEGIGLGAVQVPANGLPIILLNDRQTIGGYPKLGAVVPRSLDALAQRQPGDSLQFRPVALHDAQRREQSFLRFFRI